VTLLSKTLPVSFFERSTLEVTRDLLGCSLNRRFLSGIIKRSLITEVEAYTQDDPACHAYRGPTKRNQVLFGAPGMAYVYFIYGMYYCLNVVTEVTGVPGAVLIRGLAEPGLDGPGKICREWEIDLSYNGLNLTDAEQEIWIGPKDPRYKPQIEISTRIGIGHAEAKKREWRFLIPSETKPRRRKSKNGNKGK